MKTNHLFFWSDRKAYIFYRLFLIYFIRRIRRFRSEIKQNQNKFQYNLHANITSRDRYVGRRCGHNNNTRSRIATGRSVTLTCFIASNAMNHIRLSVRYKNIVICSTKSKSTASIRRLAHAALICNGYALQSCLPWLGAGRFCLVVLVVYGKTNRVTCFTTPVVNSQKLLRLPCIFFKHF